MTTYSLAEVAAAHLPPEWVEPERWLRARLNRGEISGSRYGRTWTMDEDDVAEFVARHRNKPAQPVAHTPEAPPTSIVDGLSERSRRRLREAS
jgi:hypothetical protein